MTILDFAIDLIGTIAGWVAIILGLAWAAAHFRRREIYIIRHAGGAAGGGERRSHSAPDPFPGRRNHKISARRTAR